LWKGHLFFRQYLPLKLSEFGIKTFEVSESSSCYIWSFIVYIRKRTVLESPLISKETPKATVIVVKNPCFTKVMLCGLLIIIVL
jgi:hypothetical protein